MQKAMLQKGKEEVNYIKHDLHKFSNTYDDKSQETKRTFRKQT